VLLLWKIRNDSKFRSYLDIAESLILDAHAKDPKNDVFEQEGLLNGKSTALEYIDHGEYGLALEHLLYMVHESEVNFPKDKLISLHKMAKKFDARNEYAIPSTEKKS